MAIFEKQDQNKVTIDDTDRLFCFIESAQNINKHTVRFLSDEYYYNNTH